MNRFFDTTFLRRYRTLIVAIGLFIAIDAALIAFNLHESYQIDRFTAVRDIAGGSRSSSQMVLRALLEMEADLADGRPIQAESRETLQERAAAVERALKVLRDGGAMKDDGKSPVYAAVSDPDLIPLLGGMLTLWEPWSRVLPLEGEVKAGAVTAAVVHGRRDITALYDAVSAMVNAAQKKANAETDLLRLGQMVGLAVVLANFLFTALLAVRRLISGDRAVAQSQKETMDILATVREGLFLLTPDYQVGKQTSSSLPDIIGTPVRAGDHLLEMLGRMVDRKTLEATKDYLELLFGQRVRESLVYSLNPLSEIAVAGEGEQSRYLSFQFNRVLDGESVAYLLVTVQDATERVRLTQELATAKTRTREEMEALLRVLSNDPTDVKDFLRRTEAGLEKVNDLLRNASHRAGGNYLTLVNEVFRHVHAIKGEAATLNLEMFEGAAHDFEVDLIALRDRGEVEGSDMVKLTLHLDDLFDNVASIRGFLQRISGDLPSDVPRPLAERAAETMHALAQRIAKSQGKEVQVSAELPAFERLPEAVTDQLRGIGVQLLRNAVAHGIEGPEARQALGKPGAGSIHFRCHDLGNQVYEFTVRDDGQGIDPNRIREALMRDGRYSLAQVQAMEDRELVMRIFEPGFSTVTNASRDAGHGAGMDVVRKSVDALGGRITFRTKSKSHTEFCVRFPWPAPAAAPRPANQAGRPLAAVAARA